jgi:hypothetical protein
MLNLFWMNLELLRRHLADIIKDNNVSLKLTHIIHEPNKRFNSPSLMTALLRVVKI